MINKIIALVLRDAQDKADGAAYSGSYTDNGAKILRDQVKFYNYGKQGLIPPEWQKYVEKAEKEADPDYAEYLRLKEKFKI